MEAWQHHQEVCGECAIPPSLTASKGVMRPMPAFVFACRGSTSAAVALSVVSCGWFRQHFGLVGVSAMQRCGSG